MWPMSKDGETDSEGWNSPPTSSDFQAIWEVGHGFCGSYQPSFKAKVLHHCVQRLPDKVGRNKGNQGSDRRKSGWVFKGNIFSKFEYPRELVTDRGRQFSSNLIEDLLAHHKIKHRTSTPYHPQANGQVEVTNRALEEILTKVVSNNRKDWEDRLVEATWAYNTTLKTTTAFTPYELVYGRRLCCP